MLETVPLACKALGGPEEKLAWWEYGNEPDLYSTSSHGPVRPFGEWNESLYVSQWLNGTREIGRLLEEHCPDMLGDDDVYGYVGPSFGGLKNTLKEVRKRKVGR